MRLKEVIQGKISFEEFLAHTTEKWLREWISNLDEWAKEMELVGPEILDKAARAFEEGRGKISEFFTPKARQIIAQKLRQSKDKFVRNVKRKVKELQALANDPEFQETIKANYNDKIVKVLLAEMEALKEYEKIKGTLKTGKEKWNAWYDIFMSKLEKYERVPARREVQTALVSYR